MKIVMINQIINVENALLAVFLVQNLLIAYNVRIKKFWLLINKLVVLNVTLGSI